MSLHYTKSTDTTHRITLTSTMAYADWEQVYAPVGQVVGFLVGTVFVGNGAPIEVTGLSDKGKKLGKVKGKITGNSFSGTLTVPAGVAIGDKVYFEANLPKHGLRMQSNHIPVVPPIQVTQMTWSAAEARRGDTLTLSAAVSNLDDGAEGTVTILEFDRDGGHDKIAELPAVVKDGRIEVHWAYEYHEDTDEIPAQEELSKYGRSYNPPEYFFTVRFIGAEFGTQQESGLLRFKDWIEIVVRNANCTWAANLNYVVSLSDGTERRGTLDAGGRAMLPAMPPGPFRVKFPDVKKLPRAVR